MNHRSTPGNTQQSGLQRTQRHAFIALIALLSAPALAQTPEAPLGCLIQPDQVADVGSSVIGLLESVKVERGDFVQKGQILATLRTEVEQAALGVAQRRADAEANLRAAEAEQGYARQRLARSEDLQRQNFLSDQALDQHRTDAKVADQRLAQAREQRDIWERESKLAQVQLQQRVIRSPFSGVVIDRFPLSRRTH
jgi:multidrug efflux pump subunit AcrA (membrane-fusion protein)